MSATAKVGARYNKKINEKGSVLGVDKGGWLRNWSAWRFEIDNSDLSDHFRLR